MGSGSDRGGRSLSVVDFVLAFVALLLVAIITGVLALDASGQPSRASAPVAASGAKAAPADLPTPAPTPLPTDTPVPSPTPPPTPDVSQSPTVTPAAFFGAAPPPAPVYPLKANAINIVLIGSDSRSDQSVGRSDVLIVASIDPDLPSLTMLSIPRDLWVYIPNYQWERINVADAHGEREQFPGGGAELVKQTIQYNLGIPIQFYARVDFGGFKELIDSVGGIDVIADCPLYDEFPDIPDGQSDVLSAFELQFVPVGVIDIPLAGVYHLDGKHALWYARSRNSSNDFARSRRQQRVLRGLWSAVQQRGLISQLPIVWDTLTQSLETDLTLNDAIYLADIGARIRQEHIRSRFLDGSLLVEFTSPTGAYVLGYDVDALKPFLDETFAPLPANVASQAASRVDVRNGTAYADWDLVAVDRLQWAGYDVREWGAAETVYSYTTIIDYSVTPKGSRVDDLARLFFVAPQNIVSQPDAKSPVAQGVIVGQDFDPCRRR